MWNEDEKLKLSIVQDYYRRILFLFLPRVCNVNCNFCYLKPIFREVITMERETMQKLDSFLGLFRNAGFEEVRITGGEPLVVSNLTEIIEAIQAKGLRYTLITNGINLNKCASLFSRIRPRNLIVSLHSFDHLQHIYNIQVDVNYIVQSIEAILKYTDDLVITILFLSENQSEIIRIIQRLITIGIKRFKLIYPNQEVTRMRMHTQFNDILSDIQNQCWPNPIEIRHTDFSQVVCLQKDRGFLSLALPDFNLYNCCAIVDHKNFCASTPFDVNTLMSTLTTIYRQSQQIEGQPCKSFISTCPLALKTISLPINR